MFKTFKKTHKRQIRGKAAREIVKIYIESQHDYLMEECEQLTARKQIILTKEQLESYADTIWLTINSR